MITRAVIVFFYCMILVHTPANAVSIDKSTQSQFLSIETDIYRIAKKNGVSKSDLTIHWKKTFFGDYKAIIKCTNEKNAIWMG